MAYNIFSYGSTPVCLCQCPLPSSITSQNWYEVPECHLSLYASTPATQHMVDNRNSFSFVAAPVTASSQCFGWTCLNQTNDSVCNCNFGFGCWCIYGWVSSASPPTAWSCEDIPSLSTQSPQSPFPWHKGRLWQFMTYLVGVGPLNLSPSIIYPSLVLIWLPQVLYYDITTVGIYHKQYCVTKRLISVGFKSFPQCHHSRCLFMVPLTWMNVFLHLGLCGRGWSSSGE